jgi:hypothetical protein
MAEQPALNRKVGGSSPPAWTKLKDSMGNPPAFRTDTDYRSALEAQKRAFEMWTPGGFGKPVMFFPTFTDPNTIPNTPANAIVVGSLDVEPGMFWCHTYSQAQSVRAKMKTGTWWQWLGIIDELRNDNIHEFTRVVVAVCPRTGMEWTSIAARGDVLSLAKQVWVVKRQFPDAVVRVLDASNYTRISDIVG